MQNLVISGSSKLFLFSSKFGRLRRKQDVKPSFTFLSKERVPYSYLVDHEAPPLGRYRPKYERLDPDAKVVNI